MRCLNIIRHHWICSFVVSLGFLSLFAFGISPESYATSVTCSGFSSSSLLDLSNCDLSVFSSSFYISGSFSDISATISKSSKTYGSSLVFSVAENSYSNSTVSGSVFLYLPLSSPSSLSVNVDISSYSFISSIPANSSKIFLWSTFASSNNPYSSSISSISFYYNFLFTDDIPFDSGSSDDCPVCPDVPDIPENPYDNKFDEVTKAIYVCGAVLIMLYFFFCIYKIIVKDGGSR